MKKLLVFSLISFSLLFQSCSSYKSIDYDSAMADKYQKIRIVMIDGTKYNGTLVKKDEQNLYISTWDGTTFKIPKKGIYEVKIQKPSYLKTGGFISVIFNWNSRCRSCYRHIYLVDFSTLMNLN